MTNKIAHTIKNETWPEKVVLAVSGGLDSTVLLAAFHQFAPTVSVVVAHVNYQLRPEADGDAAFVEKMSEKYGLPFYQKTVSTKSQTGVEEWARQVRYQFFDEIAQKTGATQVVLAQHQDDQVETLLLQLIRGGVNQPKIGMVANTGYYRRPFLGLTKADLKAYAISANLNWREDSTNADPTYTGRNKLRNEIIPALATINAKAVSHLAEFAQVEQQKQRLLSEQVETYLPSFKEDYQSVPSSWWQQILNAYLRKAGAYQVKNRSIDDFLELLHNQQKPNGQVNLGNGFVLVKEYQKIKLLNEQNAQKIQKNGRKAKGLVLKLDQWQFFDQGKLQWASQKPGQADQILVLPDDITGDLELIQAQPADKVPLRVGSKTVRRLLIDQKIPVANRAKTWLLKDQNDHVLAVWLGQSSWYCPGDWHRPKIAKQWVVWRIEENQ
ncbi:tRNA lysidine(34) synthetase TilS [Fructobacillus ficulneus]|uniref:tRNA(Ile)-lysidine synthase n=1 Tax=Fructobacillus ficulneus TaxID=157463 RepID=A0A0K8MFV6_9LACO|nr:tRNA lysidine(34) synthetase TilS [Fructobacillus ficulneus]GAO99372.1 tRNA(Ile)-lysidine synthase [Fructobacillus ficulneus]